MPICSADAAGSADGRETIKPAETTSYSAKEQTRTVQEERFTKPLLYR